MAAPTKSRFGTKLLIVLFVLLLLVAGGLVVADRVVRSQATSRVATSLKEQLGTKETPEVTFGGTPFLTQYLGNRYQSITVKAADVTKSTLPLKRVEAVMTDVESDQQMTKAVAGRMTGKALVTWQDLSATVNNLPITFVEPDRVKLVYEAQLFGMPIKADVSARPSIDGATSTVQLNEPQISLSNVPLPQDMVQPLIASLVKPIPVPLPAGLKATGGVATAEGMSIDFAGENVDLTKLQ